MRSLELWLLAGSTVLVGLAIWDGHDWFRGQTVRTTSSVALPANSTANNKARSVHGSSAKNSAHRAAASGTKELPELSVPLNLKQSTTAVAPLLGVPDSEKLAFGTTRSELRERYGVPTLAVSSVRDGGFVELYYYVKPDHVSVVIATLREGKLVSAQTSSLWQPSRITELNQPNK